MKIAIVISGLTIGGAERVAVDLAAEYKKRGHEIFFIVIGNLQKNQLSDKLSNCNIPCVFLSQTSTTLFQKYLMLNKLLKNFSPDIVHSHLDMRLSWLWCLLHGKKIVFTIHSQPYRVFDKKSRLMFAFLRCFKLIKIIAVSKIIEKETVELLKLKDKTIISTIYNPVEIIPLEKKVNIKENTVIVNVGRLVKLKNQDLLIKAFAMVKRNNSNIQLYIAGDGECKNDLLQCAKTCGVTEDVILLGDISDVKSLLMKSDIFVLSSNTEALPVSIVEAMSCALPIVATNVGGVCELVTNNGILVDSNNVDMLAKAISELVADSDKRKHFGLNSYNNVKAFEVKKIAEEYINFYEAFTRK